MRDTTIARNYAEALLTLAQKANDLRGWGSMISAVADAMERDVRVRRFLDSPRVGDEEKNEIIGRALSDSAPRLFVRYLQTLVRHQRQMLIPDIAIEYSALVDALEGRVHAAVTVARPIGDAETQKISGELSRSVGKQVVPEVRIDPGILGGVVVRIGDTVMDGSVRRRLSVLRTRMMTGR